MKAHREDGKPSPASANLGFPSTEVASALAGPSTISPPFAEGLLHFCCTDSEEKLAPSSTASEIAPLGETRQKGNSGGFNRLRAIRGTRIAPPALLSVREVARRLKVSSAIVYRLCEHGDLQHFRISNAIRIAPSDIDAFLSQNRRDEK